MRAEVEVVKSMGGKVVFDEVYEMLQCPECGADVAHVWNYCPCCGNGPFEGNAKAFETCSNASPEPSLFLCSNCGRTYVPVQILKKDDNGIEWLRCPGCGAVVC